MRRILVANTNQNIQANVVNKALDEYKIIVYMSWQRSDINVETD